MKTAHTKIMLTALALLLVAGSALADQTFDEKRQVDHDADVVIENLAGTITVVGWDKNEVQVKGRLDKKAKELEIKGGGDELFIKVRYPRRVKGNIKGTNMEIRVPEGCSLTLEGVSSDVDVSKFHGDIAINTVSGEIRIEGETREIEVASVSGQVWIDSKTSSISASIVSGDIEILGDTKALEIELVSGQADVKVRELDQFSFNAVSGELDLTAEPTKNASWDLDCHSGELKLYLPGSLDADFDIELFSGDVHNDFGPKAERTSKYGPGKELRFTAGNGSASIDISTFSADVKLVKR